ncbi:hypothetical protein ACFY3U_27265 [Micromonospora sp. NPDC000089]|uniref:hypothetical protein n=1 Tax=unclassified Micromonospora TaxID=2617518 RepID=UPI00367D5803
MTTIVRQALRGPGADRISQDPASTFARHVGTVGLVPPDRRASRQAPPKLENHLTGLHVTHHRAGSQPSSAPSFTPENDSAGDQTVIMKGIG